jgi:DNA ligase (NAD+)
VENNKNIIGSLMERISELNTSYRVGHPKVSDAEYDILLDDLKKKMPENSFNEFRKTLMDGPGGEIEHPFLMGSLDKVKVDDPKNNAANWISNHLFPSPESSLFVSSKIDGCSLRLVYSNGILTDAVTRGDGHKGFSILTKARFFVPNVISKTFSGSIRGEVVMTKDNFQRLQEATQDAPGCACSDKDGSSSYKSKRNTVAGLLNAVVDPSHWQNLSEKLTFLSFFAYEIMGSSNSTKLCQYNRLQELGFNVALHETVKNVVNQSASSVDAVLRKIFDRMSVAAPFEMDGLVLCSNDETDFSKNEYIPSNMVAFKLNALTGDTELLGVNWQESRRGIFSPVGVLTPIELGESVISAVTLYNIDKIREMNLHYHSTVRILKSGDIIPKIIENLGQSDDSEEITPPDICPSCGKKLSVEKVLNGNLVMCTNPECPTMLLEQAAYFIRTIGVKHVDTKELRAFGITDIRSALRFKPNPSYKSQLKFAKSLSENLISVTSPRLLSALGMDGFAEKTIKKIFDFYGEDMAISHDAEKMLATGLPTGIGSNSIYEYSKEFDKVQELYHEIEGTPERISYKAACNESGMSHSVAKNGIVSEKFGTLAGKTFCVTGPLKSMSRGAFEELVQAHGGEYKDSVTKKLNYLVTNEANSGSSKMKKAKELGIKIIDENAFMTLAGGSSFDVCG